MLQRIVYVLFSEKPINYVINKNEVFYDISGTFIPYFDEVTEEFRFNGKQIRKVKEIIKKHKKDKIYFLLGYDLDENGEFLSNVIENELIKLKINQQNIIRTPATEKNFILIKEKINIDKYLFFRKKDVEFITKQKENGIKKPIGLLKAIALYILYKKAGSFFKVNTNGTSTFTYLIKKMED